MLKYNTYSFLEVAGNDENSNYTMGWKNLKLWKECLTQDIPNQNFTVGYENLPDIETKWKVWI